MAVISYGGTCDDIAVREIIWMRLSTFTEIKYRI